MLLDPYTNFWDPLNLFASGEDGWILDFQDKSKLFTDTGFTTPVTTDGDNVSSIRDLSPNGRDWIKPSYGDPLLWQEQQYPYVDVGDTAAQIRCVQHAGAILYAASGMTIAFAVKADGVGSGGGNSLLAEGDASSTQSIYSIARNNGSPADDASAFIRNSVGGTPTSDTLLGTDAFDNTDNAVIITDTGSSLEVFVDGTSVDTEAYTRSGSLLTDITCLGGLARNGGVSQPTIADVYYHLAIDRVINTATEVPLLTTFLGRKMGRDI